MTSRPHCSSRIYSESTHRYRDGDTGHFLSPSSARELRDDFLSRRQADMRGLTGQVAAGVISLQDWARKMQSEIRQTTTAQYAFGSGGTSAMTAADRRAVGQLVQAQQPYVRRFAEEIAAGAVRALRRSGACPRSGGGVGDYSS
jgi:hypothetical protein